MTGKEVKEFIFSNGLKCWQVAYAWGISDGNFSRKLRKPFNEEEAQKLCCIVERLKTEQNGGEAT